MHSYKWNNQCWQYLSTQSLYVHYFLDYIMDNSFHWYNIHPYLKKFTCFFFETSSSWDTKEKNELYSPHHSSCCPFFSSYLFLMKKSRQQYQLPNQNQLHHSAASIQCSTSAHWLSSKGREQPATCHARKNVYHWYLSFPVHHWK